VHIHAGDDFLQSVRHVEAPSGHLATAAGHEGREQYLEDRVRSTEQHPMIVPNPTNTAGGRGHECDTQRLGPVSDHPVLIDHYPHRIWI
jgi:hypothetical protein